MVEGALPVGCGQCIPCRVQRRRLWAHRQLLEATQHEASIFVTLTYDPAKVPINSEGAAVLDRPGFTLFLKRLRDRVGYGQFRYFGCGEYGPQTWRPHYHVNLFGLGVEYQKVIDDCWGLGFISVFPFEEARARYCAEYVLKKMTKKDDWRLDGRTPEFMACSRNPGIGAPALEQLAKQLFVGTGWDILKERDVPRNLKIGRQSLLLGRYLRSMLREEIGMNDTWKEAIKDEWVKEKLAEMQPLRQIAASGKAFKAGGGKVLTQSEALLELKLGSIRSVESKAVTRRGKQL